jgi:lysozyme
MTPDSRKKLKELLCSHESYKQFPYTDLTGHLTIGIGRNLSDRGISSGEALQLLDDDVLYFSSKLNSLFPFFINLDEIRQIALIDMCFNLGINGLLGFQSMLEAIEKGDMDEAARQILDSKAAHQCTDRYQQIAYIMKTGEL